MKVVWQLVCVAGLGLGVAGCGVEEAVEKGQSEPLADGTCGQVPAPSPLEGLGDRVTQTHEFPAFDRVIVDGAIELELEGDSEHDGSVELTVQGPEELLALLDMGVDDGQLRLLMKPHCLPGGQAGGVRVQGRSGPLRAIGAGANSQVAVSGASGSPLVLQAEVNAALEVSGNMPEGEGLWVVDLGENATAMLQVGEAAHVDIRAEANADALLLGRTRGLTFIGETNAALIAGMPGFMAEDAELQLGTHGDAILCATGRVSGSLSTHAAASVECGAQDRVARIAP